jgi:hypothetical protein
MKRLIVTLSFIVSIDFLGFWGVFGSNFSSPPCSSISSNASTILSEYALLPTLSSMETIGKRLGEQALAVLEELPEIVLELEELLVDLTTRLSFERAVERHEAIRRGSIMRSPVPTAVPRVFENVKGDIETVKNSSSSIEELMVKSVKSNQDDKSTDSSSSNSKMKNKKYGTRISIDEAPPSTSSSSLSSSPMSFSEFDWFKARVTMSIMRARSVHSIKLINVGVKEDYEGRIVQTFSPSLREFIYSSVGASSIYNEVDETKMPSDRSSFPSSNANAQPQASSRGEQQQKTVPNSSSKRSKKSSASSSRITRIKEELFKVLVDNSTLTRFAIVYPSLFDKLNKKYQLLSSSQLNMKKKKKTSISSSFLTDGFSGFFSDSQSDKANEEKDDKNLEHENEEDDGAIDFAGVASWTPPWRDTSSDRQPIKEGRDQSNLDTVEERGGGGGLYKRRNGDIVFDPIALGKLYGIDGKGGNIGGLSWRQNQGLIRPIVNARTKREGFVIALVRLLQLAGVAVSPFRLVLWEVPRVLVVNPSLYILSKTLLKAISFPPSLNLFHSRYFKYFKRLFSSYLLPISDFIEGYIINAFIIQMQKLRVDWALRVVWNTSDQMWEVIFPFADPDYARPEVAASKRAIIEIASTVKELKELMGDAQNILYASINVATSSWVSLDFAYNGSSLKKELNDNKEKVEEEEKMMKNNVIVKLAEGPRTFSPLWATLAGLPRNRCPSAMIKRGGGGGGGGGNNVEGTNGYVEVGSDSDDLLQVCPFKTVYLNGQDIGIWNGWEKVKVQSENLPIVHSDSTGGSTCCMLINSSSFVMAKRSVMKKEKDKFNDHANVKKKESDALLEKEDAKIFVDGDIKSRLSSSSDENGDLYNEKPLLVTVPTAGFSSILEDLSLLPEAMVFLGPMCNNVTGIQSNQEWILSKWMKRFLHGLWPAESSMIRRSEHVPPHHQYHDRFITRVMFKCRAFTSFEPLMKLNQSNSAHIMKAVRIGKCGLDVTLVTPICSKNIESVLNSFDLK